nr:protein disulfide isomerase-like 1-2 [Drosophila kikkawai]
MEPLVLFLLTFIASALAGGLEEDVLQLGDEDFDSTLKQYETTLVMFYAPWCGFCQRLEPEYARAAELVKFDEPPIKLAKIDCSEAGKEICHKYAIQAYPTLKIFRQDGLCQDYKGPRQAAAIADFMRVQVRPRMYRKSVKSLEQLAKMKRLAQLLESQDIDSKLAKILKNRLNELYYN